MWIGYLEEYPDYWTQGETEDELQDNIIDIYRELTSLTIPNVRMTLPLRRVLDTMRFFADFSLTFAMTLM